MRMWVHWRSSIARLWQNTVIERELYVVHGMILLVFI